MTRSLSRSSLALALCAGSLIALPALGEVDAKVPVKRITLYRSGVASFERRGTVEGDAQLALKFSTEQVNDILKSLVVLDPEGSGISVSYGSKDPLARRLASFGIDIADAPAAGEVLSRLRGSGVTITMPEGPVSGTILNVESKPTVFQGGDHSATVVHNLPFINLLTDSGVKSYNLAYATGFELTDPALREELRQALAAIAQTRSDRTKTVSLDMQGDHARPVTIAYIHESPVWKTSYRLVLPELSTKGDDAARKDKGPILQGWAIVENTTDDDWSGVTLSLVSGRPVGFTMDLYEPMYLSRPELPVPVAAGASPRLYDSGIAYKEKADDVRADVKRISRGAQGAGKPRGLAGERMEAGTPGAPAPAMGTAGGIAANYSLGLDLNTDGLAEMFGAQSAASGEQSGQVFSYTLDQPVTIARQQSAMLPIVGEAIEGRRVSIYSTGRDTTHPMHGAEMRNTTGLTFVTGPIAVFDGGTYAGDASLGDMTPGEKRLIAYAIDQQVRVAFTTQASEQVTKVKIHNGVFQIDVVNRWQYGYDIVNNDPVRARTLVVEVPRITNATIVGDTRPAESTEGLHRFEVELPVSGETKALKVAQEMPSVRAVGVRDMAPDTFRYYVQATKVSLEVVRAFEKVGELNAAVTRAGERTAALERERQEITQDQQRMRDNMGAIDRGSDLYTRLIKKLNDQETRMEALGQQTQEARAAEVAARQALDNYINTLSVE